MIEKWPAFPEPPIEDQGLPGLSEMASGWKCFGGVLRDCWNQLMATPTAEDALKNVGISDYHSKLHSNYSVIYCDFYCVMGHTMGHILGHIFFNDDDTDDDNIILDQTLDQLLDHTLDH